MHMVSVACILHRKRSSTIKYTSAEKSSDTEKKWRLSDENLSQAWVKSKFTM